MSLAAFAAASCAFKSSTRPASYSVCALVPVILCMNASQSSASLPFFCFALRIAATVPSTPRKNAFAARMNPCNFVSPEIVDSSAARWIASLIAREMLPTSTLPPFFRRPITSATASSETVSRNSSSVAVPSATRCTRSLNARVSAFPESKLNAPAILATAFCVASRFSVPFCIPARQLLSMLSCRNVSTDDAERLISSR